MSHHRAGRVAFSSDRECCLVHSVWLGAVTRPSWVQTEAGLTWRSRFLTRRPALSYRPPTPRSPARLAPTTREHHGRLCITPESASIFSWFSAVFTAVEHCRTTTRAIRLCQSANLAAPNESGFARPDQGWPEQCFENTEAAPQHCSYVLPGSPVAGRQARMSRQGTLQ